MNQKQARKNYEVYAELKTAIENASSARRKHALNIIKEGRQPLVSVEEAAAKLKITPGRVRVLIRNNRLPAEIISGVYVIRPRT